MNAIFPQRLRDRLSLDAHRRSQLVPIVLIVPAFLVVFALAAFSFGWLLNLATSNLVFGEPFDEAQSIGLENFRWLLFNEHSTFWHSMRITGIYVVGTLVPEFFLGFTLALLLNRQIWGRSVYTAILIIPIVLMPSMVGMVGRLYFSFDGLVNFFLETLFGADAKLNWFGQGFALRAVILVDIWEWTPFFVLILLAGLQALPREPYEAALVDGASRIQSFFYITVPLLMPLIVTGLIIRFMDVIRIFDVIFAMFGGGPGNATTTLPLYIYRTTLVAENVGRGSAASVMLITIIVSTTFLLVQIRERVRLEI